MGWSAVYLCFHLCLLCGCSMERHPPRCAIRVHHGSPSARHIQNAIIPSIKWWQICLQVPGTRIGMNCGLESHPTAAATMWCPVVAGAVWRRSARRRRGAKAVIERQLCVWNHFWRCLSASLFGAIGMLHRRWRLLRELRCHESVWGQWWGWPACGPHSP